MGPFDPRTKKAWNKINERFGQCPKCGTDPFENYAAIKSYSKPSLYLTGIVAALAANNVVTVVTSSDKVPEFGEYVDALVNETSSSSGLAKISSAVMSAEADVSNVRILDSGKFECQNCSAVWNPEHWETSLSELGLTAAKY
ncbi:hypothetical protein [Halorussus aquaticus]|uniref:Uncharacterized protein n=1 Tax=Halorussus aquaticus TaxID=2953748 RepID=A0ABD5PXI8_9EURY|nr:hypothetical protein [Halorussus aquaticus]